MSEINKQAIIDALAAEERGLCAADLYTTRGSKPIGCAIGALLFRAGFPSDKLSALDSSLDAGWDERCLKHKVVECIDCDSGPNEGWEEVPDDEIEENKALKLLKECYGLNYGKIHDIMNFNDSVASLGEEPELRRRDLVIKYIEESL